MSNICSPTPFNLAVSHFKEHRLKSGTVIFCDFDGPIVDVSERYYQTYRLSLANTQTAYAAKGQMLPIQPLTKEQFWQMKRDRVADVEIAMRSGLMNEQIDAFLANVHQIVNRPASLHQDHLQAGVPQAFATLKTYGVQIILVTLRQQQQVERIMQSYGLRSSISAIFGAQDRQSAYDNHADHKTALLNDAIAEAHRRRWTPGWMIGDTEADILAGQSLHIPTISLTCGIRSRLYLEQFQPDLFQHNLLSAVGHLLRHRDRALVTQPCFA